ncbi:MAG TPA: ergothioneine biosynthesis protein EgtB [Candidatus Acidoferrales bacterium]|nr:ergothioneine biosynthesis protein EgtB [Candidatus Acidoferrales bacterium]
MQLPMQAAALPADSLHVSYRTVRAFTERLCEPLAIEDYGGQSMPDASPVKWHLAHTTWFFETFVLKRSVPAYHAFHPQYEVLFNSYYNTVGAQFPRPQRGILSRPTVEEVYRYRRHVDAALAELLEAGDAARSPELLAAIEIGVHHEQQHQELILTDLKHLFACNPLRPAYAAASPSPPSSAAARAWLEFPGGLREIGHDGGGFAFDNETPRHRVFLDPFALATRLVTNGELLSFIDDGGYRRPELWLADGWDVVRAQAWQAPLYWEKHAAGWMIFTLAGMQPLNDAEPVCHISYYEADAFARWAGARLPRETEWEVAAAGAPLSGNFVESGRRHPAPADATPPAGLTQIFGDVWEWTQSPYVAYPGFQPLAGAFGEYNAKFMSSQMVLRGGSCASPRSHLRATYRNFFPPAARWQFMGLRLARDAS